MHAAGEPAILYFGTPVVVISTVNDDGSANLAPMSSAFWLGWRCVPGLGPCAGSQTARNLRRSRRCVLNRPRRTTCRRSTAWRSPPVRIRRRRRRRHAAIGTCETSSASAFTAARSHTVDAPRVRERPVQMEAVVESVHGIAEDDEVPGGRLLNIEVRIVRVHLDRAIAVTGCPDRVDPDRWRPLIMSFQKFNGLSAQQVHASARSRIEEAMYRRADVGRARRTPFA